jgi:alanine-alpha-ketoisovalerate/valine-pyruvate aminotransferase
MYLYHGAEHDAQSGFYKAPEQLSDISEPLRTYFNGIWRNFFGGNPATLPDSFHIFQKKIENLFADIGIWERWCKMYEFLEYMFDSLDGLVSEADINEIKLEIKETLIDNEIGYQLIDGKFELIKEFTIISTLGIF